MIKLNFGEQSNVRYDAGLVQKCTLNSGQKGAVFFLEKNPVVIDSSWSPTVKRLVDIESAAFYNAHATDFNRQPSRRYYFLVARFDMDNSLQPQILFNTFRLEYLDLAEGTYKDFCDASVAQQGFNGAILTKVDKSVNGKNMSYIKPYPSTITLSQEVSAKVSQIVNDPNELQHLWEEFRKGVGVIDGKTFEALLAQQNGNGQQNATVQTNVQYQSPVMSQQTVQQPTQTVQQPTQTVQQPTQTVQQPTQTVQQPTQTVQQDPLQSFGADPFVQADNGLPF